MNDLNQHPVYEFFRKRHQERPANFPWELDDKQAGKRFAAPYCRVPETLGIYPDIASLANIELPWRSVLKPSWLHSNKGIQALVRIGPDRYLECMDMPSPTTRDQILADLTAVWRKHDAHNRNLAHYAIQEEFIRSPMGKCAVPLNFKVYFVRTRPVFVCVINHNCRVARFGFYSPFGASARPDIAEHKVHLLSSLPMSDSAFQAHVSAAQVLADAFPATPFVCVDLLVAEDGPVFGEFGPAPGGPFSWSMTGTGLWRFTEQYLDSLWEDLRFLA